MQTTVDEGRLKELLKTAFAEVMEERRDLVRDMLEETLEDIALAHAIHEGVQSEPAPREEVFAILECEV